MFKQLVVAGLLVVGLGNSVTAETISGVGDNAQGDINGCAISSVEDLAQSMSITIPNLSAQDLGLVEAGDNIQLRYDWTTNLSDEFTGLQQAVECHDNLGVTVRARVGISEGPLKMRGYASGQGLGIQQVEGYLNNWSISVGLPSDFKGAASINQTITIDMTIQLNVRDDEQSTFQLNRKGTR